MLKAWRGILRSIHRAALRLARGHRNPRRLAAAVAMSVVKEHRHLTYRELEAYVEEHPDLVGMCRMAGPPQSHACTPCRARWQRRATGSCSAC